MSQQVRYGVLLIVVLLVAAVPFARQLSSSKVEVLVIGTAGPLAGAGVEMRPAGGEDVSKSATDGHGRATLEVWPGTYRIQVQASGYQAQETGPVEIAWLTSHQERIQLAPR